MNRKSKLHESCEVVMRAIEARRKFFDRHIADDKKRENIRLALDNALEVVQIIRDSPLDI